FDGVCNLCHAGVQFILKRDPQAKFRFAALQSAPAQNFLAVHPIKSAGDTMILVEGERVSTESTAALRIARYLKWPWPLLYAGILLPRCLRDPIYRWVARNRYGWFGKREECWLPAPEFAGRFLK